MRASAVAVGLGRQGGRWSAHREGSLGRAGWLLMGLLGSQLSCATASPPPASSAASAPASAPSAGGGHAPRAADRKSDADREDEELDRVAAIHGAPGPWAVAGYRMGRYALAKLGLSPGSFDLVVTHHTPQQVMYSCIADGAAAATGASAGKLNLKLVESRAEDVETIYLSKSTGRAVTLRPTAKFRARFSDAPRERAREFGREVLRWSDADVFEEVTATAAGGR